MASFPLALVLFAFSIAAREIVFPPVAGIDAYQTPIGENNDVDILSGSAFSGLTTFANLPYITCFDDRSVAEKYDIAILGAPFDTVSMKPHSLLSCSFLGLYIGI